MEGLSDDVDEADLAMAMSTELTRPAYALYGRRTRSYNSLRDAEVNIQTSYHYR